MAKETKRIVVKIGSSVIAPKGKLDAGLITKIVEDILKVEKKGYKVVLVSSGAIACGLSSLGHMRKPNDTYALMAISSLGQIALMDAFNNKFKKYKRMCAQILLTWDDFDKRKRFINIQKTIDKILSMGVTPIINENDVTSFEEIRFGDNDRLSALVADLIGAKELIMLSDIEGLLEGKRLVKEVHRIDKKIASLAKEEDKTHTSGGMITKLEAARIATASGIKTTIAYGRRKGVISSVIDGKGVGTSFLPTQIKEKARKRWIASSKNIKGNICVDDGAKEALLNKGRSLLNVGITDVQGPFQAGDAVSIIDSQGEFIGCGIANYSSDKLKTSKKKKLEKEVVHRDNFSKVSQDWCYRSHLASKAKCKK